MQDSTAMLMAQLFDVTSDAIIVIDAQQHILRFNKGAEYIFGYTAAEMLGQLLNQLLPERFAQVHQRHVQDFGAAPARSREMGERIQIWGLRKDGSEFPAAAGISKLENAGEPMYAVVLRDVTAQRKLEEVARARSTQTAVVAERNRLARDLHDAVTQSLFSANIMAEVLPKLWEHDREQGLQRLHDIQQLTRSALAEVRTLLLELRPTAITESKLGDLLQQLAEATHYRAAIEVTVSVDEKARLPGEVQVAFYRIAQEALHNVSKHSRATHARVQLSLLPRTALLLVHDDGCGFAYQGIAAAHLGLHIMHERAEEVGATIQIESAPGHGTDVLVTWNER